MEADEFCYIELSKSEQYIYRSVTAMHMNIPEIGLCLPKSPGCKY